ncbi:polyprenyl synthetase family protein [Nocardia pseudobrasiliensis]|uniref:Geranylgeranyl diphosphate synthase type I n=1 Tax=Nocardia pseudobrasiliensis TaxID=45979 RepID=A0A370IC97_9NOCA|nr:polyprenyl synthetase family protein [Nocardia pseudobrasiliensis]RDI68240.1 geranylgeranyl diphosphate synthase type I [Nocardia pseudobrasiliensis]
MTDTVTPIAAARAAEVLKQARRRCEPALREAISALPDPLDLMAAYHMGWCDAEGNPTDAGWGKGLRGALVFAAANACGVDGRTVVPAAVAVELVHNFTLIHDDVIDVDRLRRGRATVWTVWGVPQAICLGDALHALAIRVLTSAWPSAVGVEATSRVESAIVELCLGQSRDCAFEKRVGVRVADYLAMARGKTGALTGCATALGALCAGADSATVGRFESFGRELGLAFQLTDDILGIWGDPVRTGKPIGGDLMRRKRSFPVVAALSSGTAAAVELEELYRSATPITVTEAARAAVAVQAAGGRRAAALQADERVAAAIAALPNPNRAQDLLALIHFVTHRNH